MPETLDANKVNTMAQGIDVLEDYLLTLDRELLEILLFDRTTRRNILWATKDYEEYGADYAEFEEPVRQYIKIGGSEIVLLDSGVYRL